MKYCPIEPKDKSVKDIYAIYTSQTAHNLDYMTFLNIYKAVNKALFKMIILDSQLLIMPHKLGSVKIAKKQTFPGVNKPVDVKYIPKDWQQIKKTGKLAFLTNEHRNGYKYSFRWNRGLSHPNIKAYKFIPSRGNKRMLAMVLKTMPEIEYF